MKKAKLMLSVLGVLVVIATALAFKANMTYQGNLRCATTTTTCGAASIAGNLCPWRTYTTTAVGGVARHCKPINAPDTQPCVVRRVVTNP